MQNALSIDDEILALLQNEGCIYIFLFDFHKILSMLRIPPPANNQELRKPRPLL